LHMIRLKALENIDERICRRRFGLESIIVDWN
jgi:hypothetical protein